MKLTNTNNFSNTTKKQLQSNFLSLIKESVMDDLNREGLKLNQDTYESIENNIIESFDSIPTNRQINEIEDVTLDDIVEVETNDDEYIEDLTESQVFDKLYKYIMETQGNQEKTQKIIKENKDNKNSKKQNTTNKKKLNRRSKNKMSIIDRKRRKYIKESLNKIGKKRLKESDREYYSPESLEDEYRRYVLPEIEREEKKKGSRDIPKRLQAWNDLVDSKVKDGEIQVEDEAGDNKFWDWDIPEEFENPPKLTESNNLTEQDEDESGIDELFDEESDDDKKDKDKKDDKDDKEKKPKPDATGPHGKGGGPGEGKQDGTGLDKDKKDKKSDKDEKEDEVVKKVKELYPDLKSKKLNVKMGKQMKEPKGFTIEVTDDKNKEVSTFFVIETSPKKEEKKNEKKDEKESQKKEEEDVTEQVDQEYTDSDLDEEVNMEGNVEQDVTISESKRKRRNKKSIKESDYQDIIDQKIEKFGPIIDDIYDTVGEIIQDKFSGKDNQGTETAGTVNDDGQDEMTDNEEVSKKQDDTQSEPASNNSVPEKSEKSPNEQEDSKEEHDEQEKEKSEENDEETDEKDIDMEGIDELFKDSEEPDDELEDISEYGSEGEDEMFNETLTESFVRLFDINPKTSGVDKTQSTIGKVKKTTSPKDYSPEGKSVTGKYNTIHKDQTKDYLGDQKMKFPTENTKQKRMEKNMEDSMKDLKKIF